MRYGVKLSVLFLVIAVFGISSASGDEVRLRNGDRITGKVGERATRTKRTSESTHATNRKHAARSRASDREDPS